MEGEYKLSPKHSLNPPYNEDGVSTFSTCWMPVRDCLPQKGYISLTRDMNGQAGGLWNKEACHFLSWKVVINYRMFATTDIIADGLAFWYVPYDYAFKTGEVYGGMNDFKGLLVAMDNFQNMGERRLKRHKDESLILAVYHERPKCFYFPTANEGHNYGERVRRNRLKIPQDETVLTIAYDYDHQTLIVSSKDLQGETECFRVRDLNIPSGYHFGLTARTGLYNCNHDILSMETYVKSSILQ